MRRLVALVDQRGDRLIRLALARLVARYPRPEPRQDREVGVKADALKATTRSGASP
jgi:hypothetical protein